METVQEALSVIKQAMVDDDPGKPGSLAHGWHCNIAMACYDAILSNDSKAEFAHDIGNDAASRFMKLLFNIETKG